MALKILLVNPPIYDFAAYDFRLKPAGLLSVAGLLRGQAQMLLFDYLDRLHPEAKISPKDRRKTDLWSCGPFNSKETAKPFIFLEIPRYYRRFGLARELFLDFLIKNGPFDFVLIQTVMTYWYPGVREVVEDIRRISPGAKIVLGGPYASICPEHAGGIGADLVVKGSNLEPLWDLLNITEPKYQSPLWEAYDRLNVGVLKLSYGCPYKCTYCCVSRIYPGFVHRGLDECIADVEFLGGLGVKEIAFYDDALLYEPGEIFIPFLEYVIKQNLQVNFHTPNGLAARYISADIAKLMVKAGFKTFYLGFESASDKWQEQTGSKIFADELSEAVRHLKNAGAEAQNITAYQILGHPFFKSQQLEESMYFSNGLGIRVMLSDFSPIPHTPDGEYCRRWINLDEPLTHNKTAFPITLLGNDEVNRLKDLCRKLNHRLNK